MRTTDKSGQLFATARKRLPGGVSSPVRAFSGLDIPPVVIASAGGAFLTDVDSNEYTDFCQSWGAHILGHGDEAFHDHLYAALKKGTSYGAACEEEIAYADLLCSLVPSLDRIRFVSSGTEAVMSAIRLARAFTKRNIIVKFDGCYHGHSDSLLVSAGSGLSGLHLQSSSGIPESVTENTVSLPYNDAEILTQLFLEKGEKIAAVIVEPVAANMGLILPKPEFLNQIKNLTEQHDSLLIFDEVITGFRIGIDGAQGHLGIRPDLSCFGKIIGGGFPAAAFGGRAEIMEMLAPTGNVYQAGTLSGNPVAMQAGHYVIGKLADKSSNIYRTISDNSLFFEQKLSALADRYGFVTSFFRGMFSIFFADKIPQNFAHVKRAGHKRWNALFRSLLDKGIYLSPSSYETNFINYCHTREILESTVAIFEECFSELHKKGEI